MKKGKPIVLLAIVLTGGILFYFVYSSLGYTKSKYDNTAIENPKIITMFDEQVKIAIDRHTHSVMYPGYTEASRLNTINFISKISILESFARYGVESTRPHNALRLKVTFSDGTIADDLYTGQTVSGYMGPALIMKIFMKDGKTTKVLTNGVEMKGSPDWINNDLYTMINSAISFDISRNPQLYFPPKKTAKDFEQEWKDK